MQVSRWPRRSKQEKKLEKKWRRRERTPDDLVRERYARLPDYIRTYNERSNRFAEIRRERLEQEEPDHMDLRPWRRRWAIDEFGRWIKINFYDFTTFEAACAGSVC